MSDLRVGLLGNAVQESYGGINYVINLLRALACLPPEARPRVTLFADPRAPNAAAYDPVRPLADSVVPLSAPAVPGSSRAQRLMRIATRLSGVWARTVLAAGRRTGCEVLFPTSISLGAVGITQRPTWIGWVYDLQHAQMPEFFSSADRRRRDYYFAGLARQAPRLVVSSRSARADWLRLFPATAPRVSVLSFTAIPLDEWYAGSPEGVVAARNLPSKYLALPNQFWIHKDHLTAFEAVRLLRERGLLVHLVCTGATGDVRHPEHFEHLKRWIANHDMGGCIHILGLLPAAEQIQVVRAAAAVVQPSLFEGWSTVVEEARALGKTVFLSDLPVHREQDPPRARFFPPRDAEALAGLLGAEWDSLAPGPRPADEYEARLAHTARVEQYARTFTQIAREAAPLA